MKDQDEPLLLRDRFAIAALTGILANSEDHNDRVLTPANVAYSAYQMADAMLKRREL